MYYGIYIILDFKGAGSRVRPRADVFVLKVVDGANPPQQQLKVVLGGNRIGEHREDFNVFHLRTNIFASPKPLRLILFVYFDMISWIGPLKRSLFGLQRGRSRESQTGLFG